MYVFARYLYISYSHLYVCLPHLYNHICSTFILYKDDLSMKGCRLCSYDFDCHGVVLLWKTWSNKNKEKFLLGQRRSGNLNELSCIGQHSLDVGSVQKIKKKCLGRKQMSSFAWQSPIVSRQFIDPALFCHFRRPVRLMVSFKYLNRWKIASRYTGEALKGFLWCYFQTYRAGSS